MKNFGNNYRCLLKIVVLLFICKEKEIICNNCFKVFVGLDIKYRVMGCYDNKLFVFKDKNV